MNLIVLPSIAFELSPARSLRLREAAPGYNIVYLEPNQLTPEHMAEAEILFGCPPPELLSCAPVLRWHHLPNAGVEPYSNLTLYANRTVTLTNASGVYGSVIAEHTLGMVLGLLRRLPDYARAQEREHWERHPDMRELSGSTVLILGLGDLGLHIARLFRAFDCKILGVRRNFLERPPEADEVYPPHALADILPRADIIINALPSTKDTRGIFNAEMFSRVKRGCVFVNVGRGDAVIQDDLIAALKSGDIWGAALDVTCPEPLLAGNELWSMENVFISPHSSGASRGNAERNYKLFMDLLTRFLSGRSLYNRVDFLAGY